MLKFSTIGFATAIALIALTNVQSTKATLLTNGGFEDTDSNGSFGDGWGSFGNSGFNAFFGSNAHASLFADNTPNSGGVFQNVAGAAGVEYQFSLLDTRIEASYDARTRFGLEFYLADNTTKVGESLLTIADPGVEVNNAVYTMSAVAPAGTAIVRPIVLFDQVASSGGQRNVFIFDSSLTVIPEPSTLIAGLLGASVLMRRAR
jgi:hypothetical protein